MGEPTPQPLDVIQADRAREMLAAEYDRLVLYYQAVPNGAHNVISFTHDAADVRAGRLQDRHKAAIAAITKALNASLTFTEADVERVARAIAGHFGPNFEHLPRDETERREWIGSGSASMDWDTQSGVLDAARAALTAFTMKGAGE